jgi:hypothetical protein
MVRVYRFYEENDIGTRVDIGTRSIVFVIM